MAVQIIKTKQEAAQLLLAHDNIVILCHNFPDGDTLGSGFALCRALRSRGKRARVDCSDLIPAKYSYMIEDMESQEFEPDFIVCVDVADARLLGKIGEQYGNKIDFCIDHHMSNTKFSKKLLLEERAATAEIIYEVILAMGVAITPKIAECIYTGITTDTGCFRYSNTTASTHMIAAALMETGINASNINRLMFEIKSRARFELERAALDSVEYYFGGKCAVIYITRAMIDQSGAAEGDLEGIAPLTRQIEGVQIGVTLREKLDGTYKASFRTDEEYDASKMCAELGGGGHARAAGCSPKGSREEARDHILAVIKNNLKD